MPVEGNPQPMCRLEVICWALILAGMYLCPFPVQAQVPWRLAIAPALLYEDWSQTLQLGGEETNPLLGKHPSDLKVTVAIALMVLPNVLPWKHRDWFNRMTWGVEGITVIWNARQHVDHRHRLGFVWHP